MFDATAPLAAPGIRTLRNCSARDHRFAESHRRTRQANRQIQVSRCNRISRLAALAEARANDYLAEAL